MSRPADLDCLFLHVPKLHSEYLPLGEFMNIVYMPMGLLALAHQAVQRGHRAEVVHLGIEWMLDGAYDVLDEVRGRRVRAVGLPLYWHYQTYDVLRVATAIKQASPDTFVFLGGVTASYFGAEILREFPAVDAVVQGHGEGPLPLLLDQLRQDVPDLGRVPGLIHRQGDAVVQAPGQYHATPEDIDALVFADLPLLRHHETYVRYFGFPLAFSKEYRRDEHHTHQTMGRTFFPLYTGRGCPVVCSFCGGNRDTLRRINFRNKVHWRHHDGVLDDIRRALDAGYRTVSLCFDPVPAKDDYYVTLFERIRRERIDVDFYFENWGLPTTRFLRAFADTFAAPHSYMAYSPDTGSEAVRKQNKGHYYSNDALRAKIAEAEALGVQLDIFFTIALPGERLPQALETRDLIAELRDRFTNIRRLMTWSVQLEPGSPQHEDPGALGMVTDRRTLMDFYRAHGGGSDTYSSLGYKILDYFGDSRDEDGIAEFEAHLQHLKCMEFCFLSADPRDRVDPARGRAHCQDRRQKLAERRGVGRLQQVISDDHRYAAAAAAMRAGSGPRPEWVPGA